MDIIDEPITSQMSYAIENGYIDEFNYRYLITNKNGFQKKCMCRAYADYVSEAKNGEILDILLNKKIKRSKKKCNHCKKNSLSLCSGNRGSFPKEDDTYTCEFCYSVYDIKQIICSENSLYLSK
jgi:uncharacterized protein with PIN domain